MMDELCNVEGITKQFGRLRVLDNVTFSVQGNEVLGLIGPNGSGKTTLLECISGLMPVNRGRVAFKGEIVSTTRRKEKLFYLPV